MGIRRDTYELLSRAQGYFSKKGRIAVDLSEAIDELVAASPFLLEVIAPKECNPV